jgi:transposase-like protein
MRYVSYKDRKALAQDLKPIYTASTEEEALLALESFDAKWSKQYPQIAKSWYNNWPNLVIFMQYPEAIRRVIYTTNALESVNSQFRKVTQNKRVFPNDESVFKLLYLTIQYMMRKWSMPIRDWSEAISHFIIKFDGRI